MHSLVLGTRPGSLPSNVVWVGGGDCSPVVTRRSIGSRTHPVTVGTIAMIPGGDKSLCMRLSVSGVLRGVLSRFTRVPE